MKIEISEKDCKTLINALDDKIFDLDETIGSFFQYAEESESVAYKNYIRNLIDLLDQNRDELKDLEFRLMRAGR